MPLDSRVCSLMPLALCIAILCLESNAAEVVEETWVGKDVMWKEGAVATLDGQNIDVDRIPPISTVGEESGDLLWLARAWIRKQDVMTPAQGVNYYTDKIEKDPSLSRWYWRRGWAFFRSGETENALRDFDNALRADPKSAAAYVGRAWIKSSREDLTGAMEDSGRAVEVDPKDPQARRLRGVLLCRQRKYDEGIAELSKAIELDPGYSRDYANRANAWHDEKEFKKALEDFQEAIRLDPRPPAVYAHRASTWRELGEHEQSVSDYSEAIRRKPDDSLRYFQRGSAREKLAKYDDAIADYKEAIRLDAESPFGHSGLAGLLATCPDLKYRDGKVAIVHAIKSCELTDYKNANFVTWLAAAYAEAGDSKNAVKWQQRANELTKDETAKRFGELVVEHYRQGKRPERQPRP